MAEGKPLGIPIAAVRPLSVWPGMSGTGFTTDLLATPTQCLEQPPEQVLVQGTAFVEAWQNLCPEALSLRGKQNSCLGDSKAVSYTHLTLPTILLV